LFDLVRRANKGDEAAGAAALEICKAVGIELEQDASIDEATLALMGQRDKARAGRDWARADAIRDQLQSAGWIVEDGPDGTTVRRRA
jgi:cysteinyl-tRNA synthetase